MPKQLKTKRIRRWTLPSGDQRLKWHWMNSTQRPLTLHVLPPLVVVGHFCPVPRTMLDVKTPSVLWLCFKCSCDSVSSTSVTHGLRPSVNAEGPVKLPQCTRHQQNMLSSSCVNITACGDDSDFYTSVTHHRETQHGNYEITQRQIWSSCRSFNLSVTSNQDTEEQTLGCASHDHSGGAQTKGSSHLRYLTKLHF